MYTLRSHMSVVEYTYAFHLPTTTKSSKSQNYDKFVSFKHFPSYPTKQSRHIWELQLSIYTNHI